MSTNVNIDDDLFSYLETFIKYIRADVKTTTNKVFVSWNGGHMDTTMMGTQLKSFWTKEVGDVGKRMNATLLRKLATTTIHKHLPQHKKKTADLLCHRESTATNYYSLSRKKDTAVEASEILKKAIRTDFTVAGGIHNFFKFYIL